LDALAPPDAHPEEWRRRADHALALGLGALISVFITAATGATSWWWCVLPVLITLAAIMFWWQEKRALERQRAEQAAELERQAARPWDTEDFDEQRLIQYEARRWLLLVHSATPTEAPAHAVDSTKDYYSVTLRLVYHDSRQSRDEPVKERLDNMGIKEVEYGFPKGFPEPTKKSRYAEDGFAVTAPAWGSFLALARVRYDAARRSPLVLTHYVRLPPSSEARSESR
jgi:hypothetical protein